MRSHARDKEFSGTKTFRIRNATGDSIIKRSRISKETAGSGKKGSSLPTSPTQSGVGVAVSRQSALTTAAICRKWSPFARR